MAKVGRPSKYTPELLKKAREYINNYEQHDHAFPSDIGLAFVLGIANSTLYEWAKHEDKKEFSDILEVINTKQQLVAWNKGLKNEYNANLVKLLLGKHGYGDNSNVDLTSGGDKITSKDATDLQILERYGILQKESKKNA